MTLQALRTPVTPAVVGAALTAVALDVVTSEGMLVLHLDGLMPTLPGVSVVFVVLAGIALARVPLVALVVRGGTAALPS